MLTLLSDYFDISFIQTAFITIYDDDETNNFNIINIFFVDMTQRKYTASYNKCNLDLINNYVIYIYCMYLRVSKVN